MNRKLASSNNSTGSKLASQFMKPALNGVVQFVASKAMGSDNYSIDLLGMNLSLPIVYAGVGVANEFLVELGHNWILPHIPGNKKFAQTESMMLAPALGALSNVGVFYFLSPEYLQSVGYSTPALIGAVSPAITEYGYNMFRPLV